MWIEKDKLGWMRNAHGVEKDKRKLKSASSHLEGHLNSWKGHMWSLEGHVGVLKMAHWW